MSQWRAGLWGSLHHGSPVGANWIQLAHCNALQTFAACSTHLSSHLFTIFTVACVSNFYAARCSETFYIILSTWCHKVSGDIFPCLVHLCCSLEKPGMQVKNVTFQWTLWGTRCASYLSQPSAGTNCRGVNLDNYCFYSEIFHLGQRTYAINKSCVEFCIRILPAFLRGTQNVLELQDMELHSLTQSTWSHMWKKNQAVVPWSTSETVAVLQVLSPG